MPLVKAAFPVDRRMLMRNALLLLGASVTAMPELALAQDASAALTLSPARFAILEEVSEITIPRTDTPGAQDAGVPAFIDAMIGKWAAPGTRQGFEAVLDEIDLRARQEGGASFMDLPTAKRAALFAAYDAAALGSPNRSYARLKELILTTYYLSEAGATQELRYELSPGAWEAWTKVGPDTRAWAV